MAQETDAAPSGCRGDGSELVAAEVAELDQVDAEPDERVHRDARVPGRRQPVARRFLQNLELGERCVPGDLAERAVQPPGPLEHGTGDQEARADQAAVADASLPVEQLGKPLTQIAR